MQAEIRPRYAIYFAPQADDPWWRFGCEWLGRDPASQAALPQPPVQGLPGERLEALTAAPRRYGFHATLKSPFRLAPSCGEEALVERLDDFADATRAVLVRDLEPTLMDGFVALRPVQCPHALAELAQQCVERFDDFRAPLTAEERSRRVASGLTPEQVGLLDRWGYPYVGPAYRFHLTLTGRVAGPEADLLCTHVHAELRRRALRHLIVDNLALFVQPAPEAPFQLLRRFPLCG